jgi:hypothetical protein
MDVLRAVIDTDERGRPTNLPRLPARAKIEAIFLVPDSSGETATRRSPPTSLGGLEIIGDIVGSVVPRWEQR